MINIEDKKRCCGCNACLQRCPKSCIMVQEDEEGFLYPVVDKEVCVDCGLCEKVCPVLNQREERKPLEVYAAFNKNEEIRMQSSSGGVFTALAEQIIQEGGVVFGARFNEDWEVIHDYTETAAGLSVFRGSKYVQSRIGDTFNQAEQFLKQGRCVLFSGTPCQIAGLKLFLRKEYENLLTVDFICHGVPSPGVWRKYLEEFCTEVDQNVKNILSLNFRDKCTGWKGYSFTVGFQNEQKVSCRHDKELWMRGFLADLYLRPSCYACPNKNLKSGSDIMIGDYWGIQNIKPEIDDDKGICCFLINTEKGLHWQNKIDVKKTVSNFIDVEKGNPSIIYAVVMPKNRIRFFSRLNGCKLIKLISQYTKLSVMFRVKIFMYNLLNWNCK